VAAVLTRKGPIGFSAICRVLKYAAVVEVGQEWEQDAEASTLASPKHLAACSATMSLVFRSPMLPSGVDTATLVTSWTTPERSSLHSTWNRKRITAQIRPTCEKCIRLESGTHHVCSCPIDLSKHLIPDGPLRFSMVSRTARSTTLESGKFAGCSAHGCLPKSNSSLSERPIDSIWRWRATTSRSVNQQSRESTEHLSTLATYGTYVMLHFPAPRIFLTKSITALTSLFAIPASGEISPDASRILRPVEGDG
jgi:hypothetical protein